MDNNIKEIKFVLENCESINIPYECFDKFEFTTDSDNEYIQTLNCTITDNGKIEYGMTYDGNITSPVQRLNKYRDICCVNIIYNDESTVEGNIKWHDNIDNEDMNDNQTNELIDYRTINIKIVPFIPKYSLIDIFNLTVGTTLKGEDDGQIYEIESNYGDNNKYLYNSNINKLTEQQVRQSYIQVS